MLRKGEVRLDGGRVKADHRVEAGQIIRVPPMPDGKAPPPERRPISDGDRELAEGMVIYRDPEVLVLNKPAGLAVQGGTGVTKHVDGMLPALKFGLPDVAETGTPARQGHIWCSGAGPHPCRGAVADPCLP